MREVDYAGVQVAVGNGQTVNASVAPYVEAHRRAVLAHPLVRKAGITEVPVVEGTRTFARQLYLFENQNRPGFNPAFPPDRPSDHQWGNAVDWGAMAGYRGSPVQIALGETAADFDAECPYDYELWHYLYHGRTPLPGLPPKREADMTTTVVYAREKAPGTRRGVFGGGFNETFKSKGDADIVVNLLRSMPSIVLEEVNADKAQFDRLNWSTTPDKTDTMIGMLADIMTFMKGIK
jgi:hypothetical protein